MAAIPKNINVRLDAELSGVMLIAAEQHRVKRSTPYVEEHDDEHVNCELLLAALAYASQALTGAIAEAPSNYWPWEDEAWKPSDDPIRNLVKAGHLIAAEIDRLQRKEERS